jgi:hypothetical protein
MASDQIQRLEALLAASAAAHGVYEERELNGVYDEDWPRWYAGYAVAHGLGELVGRAVTVDEVATFFASSWDEIKATDPKPTEPWAVLMARRVADGMKPEAGR